MYYLCPVCKLFFRRRLNHVKYNTVLNNCTKKELYSFFSLQDLDPCLHVTCYFYGLCKAFGPHDARCVCLDRCPSLHEPVCSSNGTTYGNECLFKRETCLLRRNFSVQHPGRCEGKVSNGLALYWTEKV